MFTSMTRDAAANDVFHQLGGYTSQADRAIMCSVILLSFLKTGARFTYYKILVSRYLEDKKITSWS